MYKFMVLFGECHKYISFKVYIKYSLNVFYFSNTFIRSNFIYLSKKRKENFKYHFFKYHHFLYSFILSVYQIRMFVNKCKKEILF